VPSGAMAMSLMLSVLGAAPLAYALGSTITRRRSLLSAFASATSSVSAARSGEPGSTRPMVLLKALCPLFGCGR